MGKPTERAHKERSEKQQELRQKPSQKHRTQRQDEEHKHWHPHTRKKATHGHTRERNSKIGHDETANSEERVLLEKGAPKPLKKGRSRHNEQADGAARPTKQGRRSTCLRGCAAWTTPTSARRRR